MMQRGARIGAGALVVVVGAAFAWAQAAKSEPKTTKAEAKAVAPNELTWGKAPPGLPPAVEAAVVDGDPTKPGWFAVRLRVPDGTQIRPHWHPTDEHITVLSGRFEMGMGENWSTKNMKDLPPGGYAVLPAGHRHFALARGETIVQVTSLGPFEIHYVNPSDDPRNQRSSR